MIYLFVSQWKHITKDNIDTEKRDCRVLRQPLSLLPEDILKFIENTKNQELKCERKIAYTSLFCALNEILGINDCTVVKDKYSKPILVTTDDSPLNTKIHISLSHSNGVAAVCISDEGEVGVDIQSIIDKEREERLKKRFFTGLTVRNDNIEMKYYLGAVNEDNAVFTEGRPIEVEDESFTAKWAYAESLMKLSGRGFSDISEVEIIAENSRSKIISLNLNEEYMVAISVK